LSGTLVYCICYDFVSFIIKGGSEDDDNDDENENENNHVDMEDFVVKKNGVVAWGRKAINSKYGYGESQGGSGSGFIRGSCRPKHIKSQLSCKCQTSEFSIAVLHRLWKKIGDLLLHRRSHENG